MKSITTESRSEPVQIRPFLKWAGGKTHLLPQLMEHVPTSFGRYFEPFLGGGALFFALRSQMRAGHAYLLDANIHLINAYQQVRDRPEPLLRELRELHKKHGAGHYEHAREELSKEKRAVRRAAYTIYLNKTCFNGLWRVNKAGKFNVPMGRYGNPRIYDPALIRHASAALQGVKASWGDFGRVWRLAQPNDFVYFDPPYLPSPDRPSFRSYTRDGFTDEDQLRLADLAFCLAESGVHVLLSGADTPETRALYLDRDFKLREVTAPRAINSDPDARGPVGELIIYR